MKKVVRLTESDLTRIIKLVIENETGTKSLEDILRKTKIYKLLDENSEVRVQYGTGGENEGGGVRFNIFPSIGKENKNGISWSLNGYNQRNTMDQIKYFIKNDVMTRAMMNELINVWNKDVAPNSKSFPGVYKFEDLLNNLVQTLVYRPKVYDDYEDIVKRWFSEKDYTCDKIKTLPEEKVQLFIDYNYDGITHEYRGRIGAYIGAKEVMSKITELVKNCRS